jgi:hypothetical protein
LYNGKALLADQADVRVVEKERFGRFGESKTGTSGLISEVHRQASGREIQIRLCSRRTTRLGLKVALKEHGLATFWAQDFRASFCRGSLLDGFFSLLGVWGNIGEALLQLGQPGTYWCSKETVVADLHKSMREYVLEKAVDEAFYREGAQFELAGI